MPAKVKWTSKKGKDLAEQIKQVLLSGDWGNIFAPGFDAGDIDYKALRESNDDWDAAFNQKQFQQNVKNMVTRMQQEQGRASQEANDLGGGAGYGPEEIADDFAGMGIEEDDGPKVVKWAHVMAHHGSILNSDAWCSILVKIPQGPYYATIEGTTVTVQVMVDPTLTGPDILLQHVPEINTLALEKGFHAHGWRHYDGSRRHRY